MLEIMKIPGKPRKRKNPRAKKMIAYYERLHSLEEVGGKFGVTKARVGQIFKEAGYQPRKNFITRQLRARVPKKPSINISARELRNLYEIKQESVKSIARLLDCPACAVKRLLIYYNMPVRGSKAATRLRCANKNGLTDKILKELRTGKQMTVAEIAQLYEYTTDSIYKRLRKIGLGTKNINL